MNSQLETGNLKLLTIYCDGGSRGNPGPTAAAFVAVDSSDQVIHQAGQYLGITTNNVAEYQAIILALQWLLTLSPSPYTLSPILINLDSQLLHHQLTGLYKVKATHLKPLHSQILQLLQQLHQQKIEIKLQHQLRHHNQLADNLVNQTLDAHHTSSS